MPTDHACQAAAERAARGIEPVRASLWPTWAASEPQEEVLPIVLRTYLGVPSMAERNRSASLRRPSADPHMGAGVLLVFLDGLHAEMAGTLATWYATLSPQLSEILGALSPRAQANGWQIMVDLQNGANQVLTSLMGGAIDVLTGPSALTARLLLVEDALSGVLRRMAVPADTAMASAHELTAAAASLFGLSTS
ncbi:hypothetical protein [Streptomyces sp. NPDC005125]